MKTILILAAVLAVALAVQGAGAARGGKKAMLLQAATPDLTVTVYDTIAAYSVEAWDGLVLDQTAPGFNDPVVMHLCDNGQEWNNRLYWSTNYVGEEGRLMGHLEVGVQHGTGCTGTLVDWNTMEVLDTVTFSVP